MFKHILVPLDGSQLAECVLPHLTAIAEKQHPPSKVTLIRVLEVQSENDDQPVDLLNWRISKAEAQMYLDQVAERLQNAGLSNVATAVLEGQSAQRIIEYARHKGVDLLLISSHGRSGVSRWNVSSVVRKIIQNIHISILLIRAYKCELLGLNELKYNHILLPLDGSMRAEVALPVAVELAQTNHASLALIHIIQRPEIIKRIPLSQPDQELLNQVIDRSKEAAMRYIDQLRSRIPIEVDTILQVNNDVTSTLHSVINEQKVDLIVMSAHGHSADPSRSFGTISTGLIEYSPIPLITIQDLSAEEVEPTEAEEAAREQKGH